MTEARIPKPNLKQELGQAIKGVFFCLVIA